MPAYEEKIIQTMHRELTRLTLFAGVMAVATLSFQVLFYDPYIIPRIPRFEIFTFLNTIFVTSTGLFGGLAGFRVARLVHQISRATDALRRDEVDLQQRLQQFAQDKIEIGLRDTWLNLEFTIGLAVMLLVELVAAHTAYSAIVLALWLLCDYLKQKMVRRFWNRMEAVIAAQPA